MNLKNLANIIKSSKIITINLYDENNILLISFEPAGFTALKEEILTREIQEIEIISLTNIKIKLAAVA